MLLITMCIFQIKTIISSEKWFNNVVTFFFENDKNLGQSDDAKRRKKKEDDLKAKKIYPTFCPDVKHAPMVSPGYTK